MGGPVKGYRLPRGAAHGTGAENFESYWLVQVRVFFPDSGEASIALNGVGMNPVSGQWNQEATFHNWPGPVDYLLRDDLLTQMANKSYGYAALPQDMKGKQNVEDSAEVRHLMYISFKGFINVSMLFGYLSFAKHLYPH